MFMIVVSVRAMVRVSELELNNYVASRLESLGLRLHKAILSLKQLCVVLMLVLILELHVFPWCLP